MGNVDRNDVRAILTINIEATPQTELSRELQTFR